MTDRIATRNANARARLLIKLAAGPLEYKALTTTEKIVLPGLVAEGLVSISNLVIFIVKGTS